MYFIVFALFCQRSTPRWPALLPDLDSAARPMRTVPPHLGVRLSDRHRSQTADVTVGGAV